jgi:hypothetical protein
VWLLYTFVVAYHWIKYNHAPLVTLLVLALHVFVSCALISYGFLINDMLPTL